MPSIMLYQAAKIQTKLRLSNIRSQLNVEDGVASKTLKHFSRQPLRQGLRQAAA